MRMPNWGAGAASTAMLKDSTETMAAALNNMLQVYDTSWVEKVFVLLKLVCGFVMRIEVRCWFESRRLHGNCLPLLYSLRIFRFAISPPAAHAQESNTSWLVKLLFSIVSCI
jgi:hypothetical protein